MFRVRWTTRGIFRLAMSEQDTIFMSMRTIAACMRQFGRRIRWDFPLVRDKYDFFDCGKHEQKIGHLNSTTELLLRF